MNLFTLYLAIGTAYLLIHLKQVFEITARYPDLTIGMVVIAYCWVIAIWPHCLIVDAIDLCKRLKGGNK